MVAVRGKGKAQRVKPAMTPVGVEPSAARRWRTRAGSSREACCEHLQKRAIQQHSRASHVISFLAMCNEPNMMSLHSSIPVRHHHTLHHSPKVLWPAGACETLWP